MDGGIGYYCWKWICFRSDRSGYTWSAMGNSIFPPSIIQTVLFISVSKTIWNLKWISDGLDHRNFQKMYFESIYRVLHSSWIYWGGFKLGGICPKCLRSDPTVHNRSEQADIWFSLSKKHFGNARFVVPNGSQSLAIDQRHPRQWFWSSNSKWKCFVKQSRDQLITFPTPPESSRTLA